MTEPHDELIACHDCDLLHRRRALARGEKAHCARCGALLYRGGHERAVEVPLALSLASLICLLLAHVYPLLDFGMGGRVQEATLLSGVFELWWLGYEPLAALVLLVSAAMPVARLLAYLALLVPLWRGRKPWQHRRAFRVVAALAPWAMTEVYLLGLLVAYVKLAELASLTLEAAFFAFIAHIVLSAEASTMLEPDALWRRIEAAAA